MVLRALKSAVIKDNTMHLGALTELIVDLGEHGQGVIIADNVGVIHAEREKPVWNSPER